MKVKQSGAGLSSIVKLGQRFMQISKESGNEFLMLNRGINAVVSLDLTQITKQIDFNSPEVQVYPPAGGKPSLKAAINDEFFCGKSSVENIMITAGGMHGIDIALQSVELKKVYLPVYFWENYLNILKIRGLEVGFYDSLKDIPALDLTGAAVVITDPSNPVGDKQPDSFLLSLIQVLNEKATMVIVDSPYRRIFNDRNDDYFLKLTKFDRVVITESFSKSIGLSGLRLGFIHSTNKELVKEFEVRIVYCTNGVNALSQLIIEKLIVTPEGKKACKDFKDATSKAVAENIAYLSKRGLLASELYSEEKQPQGIFVVVGRSTQELEKACIGSVPLENFTSKNKEVAQNKCRICVSVPHDKFVKFFDRLK